MPGYNLERVFDLRDKLYRLLEPELFNALQGDGFHRVVAEVRQLLGGARVPLDAVSQSLWHVAGVDLTRELAWEAAWRLAGNVALLRRGQPVRPWARQADVELVPAQFVSAYRYQTQTGKKGYLFELRVLAGTSCPLLVSTFWRSNFCWVQARALGFTRTRGKYPLSHPQEFVGLRATPLIEPELSMRGPAFRKLSVSSSQLEWNRRLLRDRTPPGRKCPFHFTHLCFRCPVGLDRCELSTHAKTYRQRPCPRCHRPDAPFDPARRRLGKLCVDCYNTLVFKEREEK